MEKVQQAWLVLEYWANYQRHYGRLIPKEETALRVGFKLALQAANQKGHKYDLVAGERR
jgi:hypothetical protein